MSKLLTPQFTHPHGALVYNEAREVLIAAADTVPSDSVAGFSKGCLFIQTDGAAGSQVYLNEGTASSSDFNPITGSVSLATLTATAGEINNVADASARTATLTAAGLVLTAAESGKIYFIDNATGFVAATLPAPEAGLTFTFINKTANTSGNHTVVTSASANILKGNQNSVAGDAGDTSTADDTISFVANQSLAGDKVELFSDGTSWFAYVISRVAAGVTFTQASA